MKAKPMLWAELARRYLVDGCPDHWGISRRTNFNLCFQKGIHIERLMSFFGKLRIDEITVPLCRNYGRERGSKSCADQELATLNNTMVYAVFEGLLPQNPIRDRGRFYNPKTATHCREYMPANGNVLTAVLSVMFRSRYQALAWHPVFAALSGCRAGELTRLRMDAKTKDEPGYVEGNYLYVGRQKDGVFPFILLHPDLRDALAEHREWHRVCVGKTSPWYFPNRRPENPISRQAPAALLARACEKLHVPHITLHGLRAYFVTVHRSQGMPDSQICALIGDRTPALINTTYGALPMSWAGGKPLSFAPDDGNLPAWRQWRIAPTMIGTPPVQLQEAA